MPAGSLFFPKQAWLCSRCCGVDFVDPVGARQSPSKLGSALAVAALQCCSSQTGDDEAGTLGVRRVESDLVAH